MLNLFIMRVSQTSKPNIYFIHVCLENIFLNLGGGGQPPEPPLQFSNQHDQLHNSSTQYEHHFGLQVDSS